MPVLGKYLHHRELCCQFKDLIMMSGLSPARSDLWVVNYKVALTLNDFLNFVDQCSLKIRSWHRNTKKDI